MNLALKRSDQGEGKQIVEELLEEPYVEYRRGSGYRIRNDPDAQALIACRLKHSCEYAEIQIEPTLSRFEQAGGFDAYDEVDVLATLDEWS